MACCFLALHDGAPLLSTAPQRPRLCRCTAPLRAQQYRRQIILVDGLRWMGGRGTWRANIALYLAQCLGFVRRFVIQRGHAGAYTYKVADGHGSAVNGASGCCGHMSMVAPVWRRGDSGRRYFSLRRAYRTVWRA